MDYITTAETCALTHLCRTRIEQLLRDPQKAFPLPFQPAGKGGRRCFKRAEVAAWIESNGRAKYPEAA